MQNHFLKTLAFSLGLMTPDTHPSIVIFGEDAKLSLKFNMHEDPYLFDDTLDELPSMGDQTRIDKGLRATQREMFKSENGARKDVTKILVLVTGGIQSKVADAEDPASIANELRDIGVKIFVVSLMGKYDEGISNDQIYSAMSIDELLSTRYIMSLTNAVCKVGEYSSVLTLSSNYSFNEKKYTKCQECYEKG